MTASNPSPLVDAVGEPTSGGVHVELRTERFELSNEPQYSGMRGVKLDADTGFNSGRVFSRYFPTVFVADSGDVEVGEDLRVPRAQAAAWFRAVADYLEATR